ncbi:MAG: TonB-dependent receptor [Woeseiaceae bacterium]|nr:TonB-dependent receptor [Woeseiaceae bacterium]
MSGTALAQEDDESVEEITVTGTQIKGAKISDALAVSVISTETIDSIGVESGDELLDMIPELGQNFFSETDTAGSVNAARGDVGAINMRNLGTGNTLTLLNGRRLVNMATYQTETVGGSLVPVNSVNSNHIPVFGVERIEILRDGASAIYGADAVAGVVNTVLKDDYEGFQIRMRHTNFDHLPRDDQSIALEWGDNFNGGATNVGVFARHYRRDRVNSQDEARWADSDFRYRFGDGSTPYARFRNRLADVYGVDSGSTRFRNTSNQSGFGQFDIRASVPSSNSLRQNGLVNSSGRFEIFPINSRECTENPESYDLGNGNCSLQDSAEDTLRYNFNGNRDLLSKLERNTVYAYANHEFESGLEMFADMYLYQSTTNKRNSSATDLGAVPLRVGGSNYYNPFGFLGSPNRVSDADGGADIPAEGYELSLRRYRYVDAPRIVDNDGDAYRLLYGMRGTAGDWDWESAITWSEATRDDISNRISNTLITQALFDSTPDAYNPFAGGTDTNIEQAIVDMFRKGESTLQMWDVKFSNPEIYELPAGPVGILAGYEFRKEKYVDDRDPRLDGTIRFERDTTGDGILDTEGDFEGDTFPFTSDIVGASPTPDGAGERTTNSLFFELQIPVLENLDVQIATRYEDFDDIGDTTVSKLAFGYRPIDQLLIRGSWSEAFRAPNLITINEEIVARSNARNDAVCIYAEEVGTLDADCNYNLQRRAQGSQDLIPEESENTSIGIVLTPLEGLTITADFWSIEKENTIGLFGEENHIIFDLILRQEAGTADCSNSSALGNPVVSRFDPDLTDTDLVDGYLSAGLCPVGEVDFVDDKYLNLDTRKLEGYDIGIYYDFDTTIGEFSLSYNGSYYTKFEQTASSELTLRVIDAIESDDALDFQLEGLGDLLGIDGNQEDRHSVNVRWQKGNYQASVQGFRISSFTQILANGDPFYIPSMTTYNTRFDYRTEISDIDTRIRLGINNVTDERAPISDSSFGFFQDAHRDWGLYYYLDVMLSF